MSVCNAAQIKAHNRRTLVLYLRSCVALFGAVMHNSGFWALLDNHVLKSDWNSCSTECGHILSTTVGV